MLLDPPSALRLNLRPRLLSVGSGDSLEELDVRELETGSLASVTDPTLTTGQTAYWLDRSAADPVVVPDVIAATGGGRWFAFAPSGSGGSGDVATVNIVGRLANEGLRAVDGTPGKAVVVRGYETAGDDGGGTFVWVTTAAQNNDGTVIVPGVAFGANTSGAHWRRVIQESPLDVRFWGALPGSNATAGIARAAALGDEILITGGTFDVGTLAVARVVIRDAIVRPLAASTFTVTESLSAEAQQVFDTSNAGADVRINNAVEGVLPEWFGAVGDGVADDLSAFYRSLDASVGVPIGSHGSISNGDNEARLARRVPVRLRGSYRFTEELLLTYYGVRIVGDVGPSVWGVPSPRVAPRILIDHPGVGVRIASDNVARQPWNIGFYDFAIVRGNAHLLSGAGIQWDGSTFLAYYSVVGLTATGHDRALEIAGTYSGTEVAFLTLEQYQIYSNNYGMYATAARWNIARIGTGAITTNVLGGIRGSFVDSDLAGPIDMETQPDPLVIGGSQTIQTRVGTLYFEGNGGSSLISLTAALRVNLDNPGPSSSITSDVHYRAVSCVELTSRYPVACLDVANSDIPALALVSSGGSLGVDTWKHTQLGTWAVNAAARPSKTIPDLPAISRSVLVTPTHNTLAQFGGRDLPAQEVGTLISPTNQVVELLGVGLSPGEYVAIGFAVRFPPGTVIPAPNATIEVSGISGGPTVLTSVQSFLSLGAPGAFLVWLVVRNHTATDFTDVQLLYRPYGPDPGDTSFGALLSPYVVMRLPNSVPTFPVYDPTAEIEVALFEPGAPRLFPDQFDALRPTDNQGIVRYTNSNPVLVTVPSGLGPAWSCTIVQEGTGQVTLAPAGGVALEGRSGLNTAGQWATIGIAALENNLLVVGGDTTP